MRILSSFVLCLILTSSVYAQGDTCALATPLPGEGTVSFSSVGFTASGFTHTDVCPGNFPVPTDIDFFWRWTAPASGNFQFTVDATTVVALELLRGSGCVLPEKIGARDFSPYVFELPEVVMGDEVLVRIRADVLSSAFTGTLGVAMNSSACAAHMPDALEPNGSLANAAVVTPGSYEGLNVWSSDLDWYRITVPANSILNMVVSGAAPAFPQLFDGSCNSLSPSGQSSQSVTNTSGAPMDVLILVRFSAASTPDDCSSYEMQLSFESDACQTGSDDSLEPNDSCGNATPIADGVYADLVTRSGDLDYYEIIVPAGEALRVRGGASYALFDVACGTPLQAGVVSLPGGGVAFQDRGLQARTLIVEASPQAAESCRVYTMRATVGAALCFPTFDDEYGTNDSCASVVPLPGGGVSGDPGLSGQLTMDHPDFFSFCLPAGETLNAAATYLDLAHTFGMRLWNATDVDCGQVGAGAGLAVSAESFGNSSLSYTNTTGTEQYLALEARIPSAILGVCGYYNLEVSFAGGGCEEREFCFGDGGSASGCTSCPCGNDVPVGTAGGCSNSDGRSARLLVGGYPSVTNDSLRLEMSGGSTSSFAQLMSGVANPVNPCFGLDSGIVSPSLDGLRCVVQGILRHGTRPIDGDGDVGVTTNGWGGVNGPVEGVVSAAGLAAGQTRYFQVIYRDEVTLGCGTGLNSSQGVGVTAVP